MIEVRNAVIKRIALTNEDHGVLSAWLHLDYGEAGQAFGGYCLYTPAKKLDCTGFFVWRVMEVVGVAQWNDLVNRPIRVRAEHDKVHAIGHFVEDKWFVPSEELASLTVDE